MLLSRKLEAGSWKLEVGRRKTEDGGRKTEDGRRRTEVGRRKLEEKSLILNPIFLTSINFSPFFKGRWILISSFE